MNHDIKTGTENSKSRKTTNSGEITPDQDSKSNEKLENLKEIGSMTIPDFVSDIFTLSIIGQIEGHMVLSPQNKATKYEHLIPQLVNIEENPNIKGLLVVLNTIGGDVEAGLAIAEMINSITKPTVSLIIGGGHSIGVPLAVSTKYSFISPTASMIIHPIRMNGLIIGVPQTFDYFSKMQDRIISFIIRNSKVPESKLRELMLETHDLLNDMGTILIGKQAVDIGLIDDIGGISQALKKLREMIDNKQGN